MARAFAVGRRHVLDAAERVDSTAEALAPFRRVVGTTSTRDRQLAVPLVSARSSPPCSPAIPPGTATALVFGPEVGGLTNDDLSLAGAVVNIPCSPVQPHPEPRPGRADPRLRAPHGPPDRQSHVPSTAEPPAAAADSTASSPHARILLTTGGFARDDTFPGVLRDLRRLAARFAGDRREVTILRGICRRVQHALARKGLGRD